MPSRLKLTNVDSLPSQADQHVQTSKTTTDHSDDNKVLLDQLNAALTIAMICVLRYRRHYFVVRGVHSESIADGFLFHSNAVLGHADQISQRIVQLGGEPDFAPNRFSNSNHEQYMGGESLQKMIKEDQAAEHIAMDGYREIIQRLGDRDATTTEMLQAIITSEEKHVTKLANLLATLPARK